MGRQYRKIITPSEVLRNGNAVVVNRTTNAIRDHLQSLLGPLGPVGDITIEVKTNTLTDSAGTPLHTRGQGGSPVDDIGSGS